MVAAVGPSYTPGLADFDLFCKNCLIESDCMRCEFQVRNDHT